MKEWLTILHISVLVLNPADVMLCSVVLLVSQTAAKSGKVKNYAITLANYEKVTEKDKEMYQNACVQQGIDCCNT